MAPASRPRRPEGPGGRRPYRRAEVPLSFVSDHVETLYEIDQVCRQKARELGIVYFARSPSLNDHPAFIRALAGLVAQRFGEFYQ